MKVEILHLREVKFEAIARGHRVICDQPATLGGSDSGMTPPEFLLVSLGTRTQRETPGTHSLGQGRTRECVVKDSRRPSGWLEPRDIMWTYPAWAANR
jgi:hypothetical protein